MAFDIFQKDPKENYWFRNQKREYGNKTQKARNFMGMLAKGVDGKPKGKIVVTYTKADMALGFSNVANLAENNRLGRVSASGYYHRSWILWRRGWRRDDNKIHDEFKDHIKSVDMTDCAKNDGGGARHNYQFSKETVEDVYDQYLLQD